MVILRITCLNWFVFGFRIIKKNPVCIFRRRNMNEPFNLACTIYVTDLVCCPEDTNVSLFLVSFSYYFDTASKQMRHEHWSSRYLLLLNTWHAAFYTKKENQFEMWIWRHVTYEALAWNVTYSFISILKKKAIVFGIRMKLFNSFGKKCMFIYPSSSHNINLHVSFIYPVQTILRIKVNKSAWSKLF